MNEKLIGSRQVVKFFWGYIKVYWIHTVVLCLIYGIGLVLRMVISQRQIGNFIDAITANQADQAIHYLIIFGILIFITQSMFRVSDYLVTYVQRHTLVKMYNDAFERIVYKPVRVFADRFAGSLAGRVKRLVTSFENFYDIATWQLWTNIIVVIATITAVVVTEWHIGVVCIGWLATYAFFTFTSLQKQSIAGTQSAAQDSHITGLLVDVFSNIRAVKSYTGEEAEEAYFKTEAEKQGAYWWRLWMLQNWQLTFHGFTSISVQVLIFALSFLFWKKGILTPGDIVAIQLYFNPVPDRMRELARQFTRIIDSITNAAEAVALITDTDHDEPRDSKAEAVRFAGAIALQNVTFSYADASEKVINDVSLVIPAGQKVGIVGRSGSGKSTLANLFLRYFEIEQGTLTIDGHDIKSLPLKTLRNTTIYVPQEPILFHRTIRENIEYGQKPLSESTLISIAKKAHVHEFVSRFPEKYNTVVGERGIKLSGGQRQRIAIARALAKDAPIIILDEATSALDSESEQVIQESFEELMHGRTTIAIAHRLSTLRNMDRIIVLEDGVIKEDGTHNELLAQKGRYFDLWQHQSGGFIGLE